MIRHHESGMYQPAAFVENDRDVLHAFLRAHPLATLVTSGADGPEASHIPMVLHPEIGPNGVLRCHLARANPQWRTAASPIAALVIFQGPEHYISPSWYPSKSEHGKVVPTWNYTAVHVRGRATLFEDGAALVRHVAALTDHNERPFSEPWRVSDAPPDYIDALTRAIVGIEIEIDTIEGKWKVSQNRPESDRYGAVAGLNEIGSSESIEMAELVKSRITRSTPT